MRPALTLENEQLQLAYEEFGFIVEDLLAMPPTTPILAEGIALLPDLVAPLLTYYKTAVRIIPAEGFQVKYFSQRAWIRDILRDCTNSQQAFENWMVKDHVYAERAAKQATTHGLQVVRVDESHTVQENAEKIARHFWSINA